MYEPSKYSLFIVGSLGATPSQCYHNHQKPTSEQDPTRNISLPTVFAGLLAVLPLQKPSKNPEHEFSSSSQNQWKSISASPPCPFPLLSHPPLPQFSCRILITLYTGGHESVAVSQNTTLSWDPPFQHRLKIPFKALTPSLKRRQPVPFFPDHRLKHLENFGPKPLSFLVACFTALFEVVV